MIPSEYRVFLLMGGALLAGILLGAMLIHKRWPNAFWAVFAGHILGALGLYIAAQRAQGMDGLGYAILLGVFALPASLGMVAGGGVAWLLQRRRGQTGRDKN